MSQSATLYRVSQEVFNRLEKSGGKERFEISSAKSYTIFQGSFMGLEYILSKGQDAATAGLISEIFNPKQSLGEKAFANMTPEEQFEFYENGRLIPFLDTTTILKIKNLLDEVSEADIHFRYDADELNNNDVYPRIWHKENSPNPGFNKLQLLEDFAALKRILKQAGEEQDYIFVFVG